MKKIETIVIAAAGRGTRLQDAYPDTPKHLIPVLGKPFLHYLLSIVREVGFSRVIVTIGHESSQMRDFFSNQADDYLLVDQGEQMNERYGTAAVVEAVAEEVGNNSFVFINGDALMTSDVLQSVQVDDGLSHIVGLRHPEPQYYGVLSVDDDGLLKKVVEKPQEPLGNLINIGVYSFQPDIFSAVKTLAPSPRGEYELTDAINILAAQQRVRVHEFEGDWVDLGRPEDVPLVESFLHRHNLV